MELYKIVKNQARMNDIMVKLYKFNEAKENY